MKASKDLKAVVIASSTGGPMALESLFKKIDSAVDFPIFIAQHLPPPFTKALAAQLTAVTKIHVKEAEDRELVHPNRAYIAPADYHMELFRTLRGVEIHLNQREKINFVRPAADPLFSSAARAYGKNLIGFVLTGMGTDGLQGAIDVKEAGGAIFIQDKQSSVVWGMPGAIHGAGAYDKVCDLAECAEIIDRHFHKRSRAG